MKDKWKTKDGVVMAMSEMDDTHIANCNRMLFDKMPDHEHDDVICADHWSLPGIVTVHGAKHYREKINEFETELARREVSLKEV